MKNETIADVFVPELMTSVIRIRYDYAQQVGVVVMPETCCVDMSGVVSYFSRIDNDVTKIITISGDKYDTGYSKTPDGQWKSIHHEVVQEVMRLKGVSAEAF